MPTPLDSLELLTLRAALAVPSLCVLAGADEFLKRASLLRLRRAVLSEEDELTSLRFVPGKTAELTAIRDELSTRSLFGDSRRMVIVEDADEFVTRARTDLEREADTPRRGGVLVLEVSTFPANTRLFKIACERGLVISCGPPPAGRLQKWLVSWCSQQYGVKLEAAAAKELIEILGPELGIIDAELSKLAAGATGKSISVEDVRSLVGGWRTKTAWEMIDAAAAGDAPLALLQLERLLGAGEPHVALMGQVGFTFRRFADAARRVVDAEAAGQRLGPAAALAEQGVKNFALEKSEQQLRQIGRHRALALYDELLRADLALKGDSALPPRTVIERLLARLARSSRTS